MGPRKPVARRQASLLKKPIIPVTGKLGKIQKSKRHGRKIKAITGSTVDLYEDQVEGRPKLRQESSHSNSAPKSLDQEIPRKLREIIAQTEAVHSRAQLANTVSHRKWKSLQWEKMRANKASLEQTVNKQMTRPVKDTPSFKQGKDESVTAFRRRVETESVDLLNKAKYEAEHDCELVTGKDGELHIKTKGNRRKEKLAEFRKKKKEKKSKRENPRDFSDLKDHVQFGDVVDRPPELHYKPKRTDGKQDKVAKLRSLKMAGLLSQNEYGTSKDDPLKSMAYKRRMQNERQRAIDLYRKIKSQKQTPRPAI